MKLIDNTVFWQKTSDFCGYRVIGNTVVFGRPAETIFGLYFKRSDDDEWVALFLGTKREFFSEEECRSWIKNETEHIGLNLQA